MHDMIDLLMLLFSLGFSVKVQKDKLSKKYKFFIIVIHVLIGVGCIYFSHYSLAAIYGIGLILFCVKLSKKEEW